jgi:hypothetical protein
MRYKDYIDLGFTRTEIDDKVEVDDNGYAGYSLERIVSENIKVYVHWLSLNNPTLIVNKDNLYVHRIKLSPDIVCDMFTKHE